MPPVARSVARHHNFVTLAFADLVIAPGAAVFLLRFVRLHVANVDRFGIVPFLVRPIVVGAHVITSGARPR